MNEFVDLLIQHQLNLNCLQGRESERNPLPLMLQLHDTGVLAKPKPYVT